MLPSGVEDLSGYPLHLIVAAWGLRHGYVLTTVIVSRAFLISQAQARVVLRYIRHEEQKHISSEQVPLKSGGHACSKGLRVLSVNLADITLQKREEGLQKVTVRKPPQTRLSPGGDGRESERQLRQWMVSRRPGEVVPDALFSTDAPY
ncbi:hypothetical protein [Citrobacter meridianamericanus]|uniref:hypothetical protein n=1 Tax=Citrobacter meridianamericanus TaxID=2894201 RepID=UPI00351D27D6